MKSSLLRSVSLAGLLFSLVFSTSVLAEHRAEWTKGDHAKTIPLRWPEEGRVQLRAEFFNIFNHPQFADPDNSFNSATFGVISSTSVNPRVGQLALKFNF